MLLLKCQFPLVDLTMIHSLGRSGRLFHPISTWKKWRSLRPLDLWPKKKAYFEAHYKKIAARKAELLEQEKNMGIASVGSNGLTHGIDPMSYRAESDYGIYTSVNRNIAERIEQDQGYMEDRGDYFEEHSEDDLITIECYSLPAERVEEEEPGKCLYSTTVVKPEEENTIKEIPEVIPPTPLKIEDSVSELQENIDNVESAAPSSLELNLTRNLPESFHEKISDPNPPRNSQKINKLNKEKSTPKIKRKPASPVQKTPEITRARVSTPISSNAKPASKSSTQRNAPSFPQSRNLTFVGNNEKVAPKSLESSCSSSSPAPQSSLSTTRKSFIMERMGDKDIVKRAFKMFQNNLGKSSPSCVEKPLTHKEIPSVQSGLKTTSPVASRKVNGSDRPKIGATARGGSTSVRPSFGSRSDERVEKRREGVKRLQEKSDTKEAAVARLPSKSKVGKDADVKTLRQSRNLRATSVPAYRGQSKPKSSQAMDPKQ